MNGIDPPLGMARRMSNKIQPAVMTLTFATPAPVPPASGYAGKWYVDLSQAASIVNRRFYRQGLNWAVAGIKVSSTTTGSVYVSKLPNTWVTSNGWEKAFRAWNKQQMDTIEESGGQSALARFRDFKIHADVTHVTAGFASNLLPIDVSGNVGQLGEWDPSQIVLPNDIGANPSERYLHMVGANDPGSSRGIIEGYADSRAYPQSPDPVSPDLADPDNWMRAMFDVGNDNEDIIDNATDRNDNLPYNQVNYPGGENNMSGLEFHDFTNIYASSMGANSLGIQRLKGGNFPCGLLAINWTPTGDPEGNLVFQIDLVPGSHRGYLAEPMTEM